MFTFPVEVNVKLSDQNKKRKSNMTVEEAGKKGGQKVRKLVEEGKEHENE